MRRKRRLIEGFWSCDKCDRTRIRARYDSCPGCGSRRNYTTKYEMLDKNNYVPDEIAEIIDRNPDWLCSYCGSLNRANITNCFSCGAPLTVKEKDYFENREKVQAKEEWIQSLEEEFNEKHFGSDDAQIETSDELYNSNASENYEEVDKIIEDKPKKIHIDFTSFFNKIKSLPILQFSLVTVGIIAIVAFLISLFTPREETLDITDFSWKSSISIEEYKTVKESDWTLPSSARLLYTNEEISHYEQVFDHYETKTKTVSKEVLVGYDEEISYRDLGNGYFEEIVDLVPVYETVYEEVEYQEAVYRDEPVYKIKYYYEIDKWVHKETITETGNGKNPYYPNVTFASNERESSRNQTYFVTGINENEENLILSISYKEWMELKEGQTVKFEVYFGNNAKVIEIID